MGIMRAVIGGNNQCHCIHVTEIRGTSISPEACPLGPVPISRPGVSLLARDDLFPCSSLDHWGRSDSRSVAYLMTR